MRKKCSIPVTLLLLGAASLTAEEERNVVKALQEEVESPIAKGKQSAEVTITAIGTNFTVRHHLHTDAGTRRTPVGWFVVSSDGLPAQYQYVSKDADVLTFMSLDTSGTPPTVTFWVF